MELRYVYQCLVLLICMTKAAGQQIKLTSQSLGSPDYYINDTLHLNCRPSGYTGLTYLRFFVNGLHDSGCAFSADGWEKLPEGRIKVMNWNYCNVIGSRAGFTLSGSLKITPNSAGLQIKCQVNVNLLVQEPSNILTISTTLKVAPKGLAFMMKNQDQSVMEGETFEFQCNTTSASDSEYRYDIKRNGIIVLVNVGNSYTPNQNDRRGFRIECEDTVHINWRGGNTSTASEIFYPLYFAIEGNKEIQRNISLNSISPAPLICNVKGNPSPAFSWQRDSNHLTETSNSIILNSINVKDGDVDTVACKATVEGKPDITITWMVTWESEAPKSTAPGTSFSYKMIGILALVIVFII